MSDNATGPRTVGDILAILQKKRAKLFADIEAAESGPHGGGRPCGFQADTPEKSLAWLQGRVDADFLLPRLRLWYQDLPWPGVGNLPPWTREPQDETAALDLLNRMIRACQPKVKTPRRKRRQTIRESKPLTAKQLEASQLYGELKGDFAAVGKRMGISRQAAEKHYKAAMKKLGKKVLPKARTQALPKDKRGQETV